MKVETITVNGKTYYSEKQNQITGNLKIVVLQRGWVLIGNFEQNGDKCKLHNACVIRVWGTTKGLGELVDGPTSTTTLDKCHGVVEFNELTMVLSISAREEKWIEKL
jgi:uncharacterized protein YunC (DUF1805 family)